MKAERIKQINEELLRRSGVDFSSYRDPELVATVSNAMTLPLCFARCISRPIGGLLLACCVAIVIVESNVYETFLAFVGFPLALINGVLLGLVLFVRRIRSDIGKVFEISARLTTQVIQDIGTARGRLGRGSDGFPGLLEIFQGVNAIVVLPVVTGVLRQRLPLAGGLAARVTERFFGLVDTRLAAAITTSAAAAAEAPPPASPAELAGWLQSAEKLIETGRGLLDGIIDKVARVVAFPFQTLFAIAFAVSMAILLLGYALIV